MRTVDELYEEWGKTIPTVRGVMRAAQIDALKECRATLATTPLGDAMEWVDDRIAELEKEGT